MLEIILLIVGIVKGVRRPKLSRLNNKDFPEVDATKFAEWHQAQLKATDIFLWATWGAFFVKLFISIVGSKMNLTAEGSLTLLTLILVGWVVGLLIANANNKKASKLKKAAGIKWPK